MRVELRLNGLHMTYPEIPRSRDRAALVALMLGYAAIFLTYYPPLAGIEDEVGFINQSLVWSRGAVSAEGAGYTDLDDFGLFKGRHLAMRHPGRSLVALPFLLAGGLRAVFTSGMVLHLAMTAVGATLLADGQVAALGRLATASPDVGAL